MRLPTMSEDYSLRVPSELYSKLRKAAESSGGAFRSPDEYALFILGETLKEVGSVQGPTPEEEYEIKERLKRLGYI